MFRAGINRFVVFRMYSPTPWDIPGILRLGQSWTWIGENVDWTGIE